MIKMITYDGPDDGAVETFTDLDDLTEELEASAVPDYTEKVLTALRAGETRVYVANGRSLDVYEVVNE